MEENEVVPKPSQATVISFISGKGGVGKTTLSLSIAKLLSQLGKQVLFVDFDLATHEASYFFIDVEGYKAKQSISSLLDIPITNENIEPINIEGLHFIPSETNFKKPSKLLQLLEGKIEYESVGEVLDRIIQKFSCYDYIIIDTQAGPVPVTYEVTRRSHKVVIMMASDITIGLAAVRNLIHKFGEVLKERDSFCIINELALAEIRFSHQIEEHLEGVILLDPIPFDSGVRLAFLTLEIPMDIKKLSPFILGVIRDTKKLFPEIENEIEELWQGKNKQMQEEIIKEDSIQSRRSRMETLFTVFAYMLLLADSLIPVIMYYVPDEYKKTCIIIALLIGGTGIALLGGISGARKGQEYRMVRLTSSSEKESMHRKMKRDGYETIKVTEKKKDNVLRHGWT